MITNETICVMAHMKSIGNVGANDIVIALSANPKNPMVSSLLVPTLSATLA